MLEGMCELTYPSDVTDAEWAVLEPLVTPTTRRGRPRLHPLRRILNAIFYLVRSGCAWRLLPRDLPPWQTVFHYFRKWPLAGPWVPSPPLLPDTPTPQPSRTAH